MMLNTILILQNITLFIIFLILEHYMSVSMDKHGNLQGFVGDIYVASISVGRFENHAAIGSDTTLSKDGKNSLCILDFFF